MAFEKRADAKVYAPVEGDTLEKIAERETDAGNPITADDIALFNWGTRDIATIEEMLRDQLGAYKRGGDARYVITADLQPSKALLIPVQFKRDKLPPDRLYTIRVRRQPPPPPQYEACLCFDDIKFEFDMSFIRSFGSLFDEDMPEDTKAEGKANADYVEQMQQLEKLLADHPKAKIMVYGHTDQMGSDKYNKGLAERRARSLYAFITNDPDEYEALYNYEGWGTRCIQRMLKDFARDYDAKYDPGVVDGLIGPATRKAIKAFQQDNGLGADGIAGPKTRRKMFEKYFSGKNEVTVPQDRFMNPPWMGCSEFNPLVDTAAGPPGTKPHLDIPKGKYQQLPVKGSPEEKAINDEVELIEVLRKKAKDRFAAKRSKLKGTSSGYGQDTPEAKLSREQHELMKVVPTNYHLRTAHTIDSLKKITEYLKGVVAYVGSSVAGEAVKPCEENRRVVLFLFNEDRLPGGPGGLPCQVGALEPCYQQMTPGPRFTETFRCAFYDSLARPCDCDGEVIIPLPDPIPEPEPEPEP
ncbi:MAG: peptidoglycan-binding protein, partial [Myxococcales bacterium]|nr:peptidoglycan-binding protein [Myxococcales bacterium]